MILHLVDYVVFFAFTASSVALGLYYSMRKSATNRGKSCSKGIHSSVASQARQEEVFLGSRSLPAWSLAVSMLASGASGVGVVSLSAHQYAYGMHFLWDIVAIAMTTPCIVCFFLPVLYRLKVTSIFEYLRMRFGSGVGVSACVIYFFSSQTLGAVSVYSAAVGISTMLGIPLLASTLMIGFLGTCYTALGGLRGVVWADCVQGVVLFAAPFIIIAKIVYDAAHLEVPLRPLGAFISRDYLLRFDADLGDDETVWAHAVGTVPFHLVRDGIDQMVVQRFLAARNVRSARRVVWAGAAMTMFFIATISLMALALTYWYHDCDPMLAGTIMRFDQVIPLYIAQNLVNAIGLRGLFLAGLLGASFSTISSIINSHAAIFYVDIVAPHFKLNERQAGSVTHFLEVTSGALMTGFAVLVPHLGSAARVLMALYSGAAGPFAGMVAVAACLPWANTRGTAVATSLVFVLVLWQTVGRTLSGVEPIRMNTTLLRCALNTTEAYSISNDIGASKEDCINNDTCAMLGPYEVPSENVFPLYQLSSYWCSLMAMAATVSLSLVLSLLFGAKQELEGNLSLVSPVFVRLWIWLGLIPDHSKEALDATKPTFSDDYTEEEESSILKLKELD
ncbi:hypothetical protein V5799_004963 [Amblyomma americanum]|uniref:Sodium/solute symporter n=1 Tax=Amblyomma americanum TaxID=6943 RepID=A0AAQ4D4L1_AMBAM